MKLVALDAYTSNPGDLSWAGLRALGECVIYDRTAPDMIVERSRDAGRTRDVRYNFGTNVAYLKKIFQHE